MFYVGGKTFKAMDNRSLLGAESHVSYNTSSFINSQQEQCYTYLFYSAPHFHACKYYEYTTIGVGSIL